MHVYIYASIYSACNQPACRHVESLNARWKYIIHTRRSTCTHTYMYNNHIHTHRKEDMIICIYIHTHTYIYNNHIHTHQKEDIITQACWAHYFPHLSVYAYIHTYIPCTKAHAINTNNISIYKHSYIYLVSTHYQVSQQAPHMQIIFLQSLQHMWRGLSPKLASQTTTTTNRHTSRYCTILRQIEMISRQMARTEALDCEEWIAGQIIGLCVHATTEAGWFCVGMGISSTQNVARQRWCGVSTAQKCVWSYIVRGYARSYHGARTSVSWRALILFPRISALIPGIIITTVCIDIPARFIPSRVPAMCAVAVWFFRLIFSRQFSVGGKLHFWFGGKIKSLRRGSVRVRRAVICARVRYTVTVWSWHAFCVDV